MMNEYIVRYWQDKEHYIQADMTVCVTGKIDDSHKDGKEAAREFFHQCFPRYDVIWIKRVIPERERPTRKCGLLARLFGRCA